MQFLHGLNDHFNNVKSHVLLMVPLPLVNKVFSLVAQQERQLSETHTLVAKVNHINGSSNINSTSSISCQFCGRPNHIDFVCYMKYELPNQDNKGYKGSGGKCLCIHYGRTRHTI